MLMPLHGSKRSPVPRWSAMRLIGAFALLSACSGSGAPQSNGGLGSDAGRGSQRIWIAAWSAAPYGPYPLGPNPLNVLDLGQPLPPPIPTIFVNDRAVDQSFRGVCMPVEHSQWCNQPSHAPS